MAKIIASDMVEHGTVKPCLVSVGKFMLLG